MKKKILAGVVVLVFAVVIGVNVNMNSHDNILVGLSLQNTEALASEGQTGMGFYCCTPYFHCVDLEGGNFIIGKKQLMVCK